MSRSRVSSLGQMTAWPDRSRSEVVAGGSDGIWFFSPMVDSVASMMEVTFDVLNMESWVNDIASKYRTTVRILDCVPWRRTGAQAVFEVVDGKGGQMLEDIRSHREIDALDVDGDGLGRVTGAVVLKDCTMIRLVLWAGCLLEQVKAEGDGKVEFKVLAGTEGSIPVLVRALVGMDLAVEIKQLVRYGEETRVTGRQRELVKLALDQGYYDYPRRVSVKELAERSNMAPSTLAEILRRAQKNILLDYFDFRK